MKKPGAAHEKSAAQIRRNVIVLAIVAAAFYVGFIVIAVVRSSS